MYTQNLITRFFGMNWIGPDPFGGSLVVVGEEAEGNPFRFSTKYADGESGLVYYGYRFYSPTLGRWISRDPIQVAGSRFHGNRTWQPLTITVQQATRMTSVDSYGYVHNAPSTTTDFLGLMSPEEIASLRKRAGKAWCPAHELEALEKAKTDAESRLKLAKSGKDPDSIEGTVTLAATECIGGTATTKFNIDTETCFGSCAVEHELLHVKQCQTNWGDESNPYYLKYKTGDWPTFYQEAEARAYQDTIKCISEHIKKAKEDTKKKGSVEAACTCPTK